MPDKPVKEARRKRLMIRVHIRSISPYDVPELNDAIEDLLEAYPDAELETSMLPLLTER